MLNLRRLEMPVKISVSIAQTIFKHIILVLTFREREITISHNFNIWAVLKFPFHTFRCYPFLGHSLYTRISLRQHSQWKLIDFFPSKTTVIHNWIQLQNETNHKIQVSESRKKKKRKNEAELTDWRCEIQFSGKY